MKRKIIFLLICFILLVFIIGCGGSSQKKDDDPVMPADGIIQESSVDSAQIPYNEHYFISNNVWGKDNRYDTSKPYTQKIYLKRVNGKEVIGWQWSWPDDSFSVVSYPNVSFGGIIWSDCDHSSTPDLPLKISEMKTIRADFDVKINAAGDHNMAFDVWVTKDPSLKEAGITDEIMIWTMYSDGWIPAPGVPVTVTIDGVVFDVYQESSMESGRTWDYTAFRPRESILNGPINISSFINYLVNTGKINTGHSIGHINFGNEVARGTGDTEISNFAITID